MAFTTASPAPADVLQARLDLGYTQREFAQVISGSLRSVQDYERGRRKMHPGVWALVQQVLLSAQNTGIVPRIERELSEVTFRRGDVVQFGKRSGLFVVMADQSPEDQLVRVRPQDQNGPLRNVVPRRLALAAGPCVP